jgi:Flp pilus assembly pilin Flp
MLTTSPTQYANRVATMRLVLRLLADARAQDMVEYALLAGFVAVAAGALLPPVADSISGIFSKLQSVIDQAP